MTVVVAIAPAARPPAAHTHDMNQPKQPLNFSHALDSGVHLRTVRRSRRHGTALENAILGAAWEELAAVGYANVTMSAVAARAGTNKATLYRRWPNRTELLAASINRRIPRLHDELSDTGDLRDDVIAVLQRIAERWHATQLVPDPGGELANYLLHRAVIDGQEQMKDVANRALDRGELPRALPNSTIRLPVNVLHSELRTATTPTIDQLIAEIVDYLFLPLTRNH